MMLTWALLIWPGSDDGAPSQTGLVQMVSALQRLGEVT